MIRIPAKITVLLAGLILFSGCATGDFLAVSVSRQEDGGLYRIRKDQFYHLGHDSGVEAYEEYLENH